MFKIQRIEITGFKSFADRTEMVFNGDGITAVVGPNGCGKSNVADAIAWVLGEQRIKQLRGGEMKDVIFQGSRNRPPSGMAEVVLHLLRDETVEQFPEIDDIDSTLEEIDDRSVVLDPEPEIEVAAAQTASDTPLATIESTDQALEFTSTALVTTAEQPDEKPISESSEAANNTHKYGKRHWRRARMALEFAPGESVTVTRRLYRSGESEYLLNGRICRLRDIQDLFSGTGLSGAHYAIIEQGRIGQILSAKPMDRRNLIEEAAGITKFRVRQRAAEARLESARVNLNRISDIISEIDRLVNSLRRQAAKARRYRVLREELRELLRKVYVAEEQALVTLLDNARAQLDQASREEQLIIEGLAVREEEAHRARQAERTLEESLAEARATAADAALQRDRRLRELGYQQEQVAALGKRRADLENDIATLEERLVEVKGECERLRENDEVQRSQSEDIAAQLQTAEGAYSQRLADAERAETEIERTRAELLSHTAVTERLMEISRQLDSTLDRLSVQAEGLAREGERASSVHAERRAEADKLTAEISAAREHLAKLLSEREAAVHAVVQGHEVVSDTDAEHTRIRDEYSRIRHRLDTLKELDERRAHFSPAVQRLFGPSGAPDDFHFMGTLVDKLNVEPQWERLVEGVFGTALQSVIVPTPDDAVRAAAWLRSTEAGRASFLVVGLHGASDELKEVAFDIEAITTEAPVYTREQLENVRLGDLLGAPPEIREVMRRTFPRRMNARVAPNLEQALSISLSTGEFCATPEGDWVTGGQLVNAGDERTAEAGAGLLAFKREIRELETQATEHEDAMSRTTQAVASARTRLAELEDSVVLLNEVIGREERDALAREMNAATLAQEIERTERHLRVVEDDASRLAAEQKDLEERRTNTLGEAATSEAARRAASEKVTEAVTLLTIARREAEAESEVLGAQRASAAAASERRRAAAAELRRTEAQQAELENRIERHRMEVAEADERLEQLHGSIAEIKRSEETVEEDRARSEREIAEIAERLNGARENADNEAEALAELNRNAATARDARAALDVQRAEASARLAYVREACMTELNQSLEELARERVIEPDFDLEARRAEVEDLRARVESFGGVNMMALEELAENEQRLEFLTNQRQDILDGIASTDEALREIKRRSRERFRNAFEQINRNFGDFFQQLFGGGRGEMSLIDADDLLESGIDIVAQPPGKRLQHVLLLSGGEKAMAALALVLGIFHYRPSPFCLLDEVDAPLDEANVGRFIDKIAEMATDTQFIVITHNKRTMEKARALYGVTMEEPGISKLVSVKFE